jgi:hypothetical protein
VVLLKLLQAVPRVIQQNQVLANYPISSSITQLLLLTGLEGMVGGCCGLGHSQAL